MASYPDPCRHACIIWPFAHTESSASDLTSAPFLTPPLAFFLPPCIQTRMSGSLWGCGLENREKLE
ncbi:hypothetical protein ABG768_015126, partial [Culter alburnus]